MNYQFISSAADLEKVCSRFENKKIVGVDLEADSMHCFKEKICLIQMACAGKAYLIDPFEMQDIDPFLTVLENPDVTKVFHGSDFDIRSLDRDYGIRVNNLFDSEIACRFLGVTERGLGALLKAHFDIIVDKRFQKVDWSRRPLKDDMIEYSIMDVASLEELYTILTDQLKKIGRLSWAQEEFEIQEQVRYEYNHKPPLFKKFKGAGKMDNRSLAVLESLLELRLEIAEEKDRPVFKVFSNASLKTMAEQRLVSADRMVRTRVLSKRQAQMYGQRCEKAVGKAMALAHKDLPSYPRNRRPRKDPKVQNRITHLKKLREKWSLSMDMEPGFLLNNALITGICVANPETMQDLALIEPIRRWQVDAMGEDILKGLSHFRK